MFFPALSMVRSRSKKENLKQLASQLDQDLQRYMNVRGAELMLEAAWSAKEDAGLRALAKGPWQDCVTYYLDLRAPLMEALEDELQDWFLYEDLNVEEDEASLAYVLMERAALQAYLDLVEEPKLKSAALRRFSEMLDLTLTLIDAYVEDLGTLKDPADLDEIDLNHIVSLRALTLSRLRDPARPIYAQAVAQALTAYASGEPAYGPQAASNIGGEVVAYL